MSSETPFEAELNRVARVWGVLKSPLRPSTEDVKWFARSIQPGDGLRVLIQGATPELVDLAIRKRVSRVLSMDWHEPFFRAMQKLGVEDWGKVEYLRNDWRSFVPDLEGSLDVVLGDGSLTMLAFPSEWEEVLESIHRYLVPAGRLILRLPFQPEEPFDLEPYMKGTISRFEADCAGANSEQRFAMLRDIISEFRIAFGLASAGTDGVVDLNRRAELVHYFHTEFDARCGRWEEWKAAKVAMPTRDDILGQTNKLAGRAFPFWRPVVELVRKCGFNLIQTEWSGNRPASGVMRFMAAERL